jgi:hypothetical protein
MSIGAWSQTDVAPPGHCVPHKPQGYGQEPDNSYLLIGMKRAKVTWQPDAPYDLQVPQPRGET